MDNFNLKNNKLEKNYQCNVVFFFFNNIDNVTLFIYNYNSFSVSVFEFLI